MLERRSRKRMEACLVETDLKSPESQASKVHSPPEASCIVRIPNEPQSTQATPREKNASLSMAPTARRQILTMATSRTQKVIHFLQRGQRQPSFRDFSVDVFWFVALHVNHDSLGLWQKKGGNFSFPVAVYAP